MDDFRIIRDRVVAEIMKSSIDDDRVETIISRMDADGCFMDINYEDLTRTAGFPQRRHTSDLVYLAKAYQNESSAFFKSEKLKETITLGFKYWVDNDFFGDNWHNNQISTPTCLVDLMLLIGDELPEDLVEKGQPIIGRAHMEASGARPSGDRVVIAGILAKNLLFRDEQKQFNEIIKLIEGEVKFTTGNKGMQHDFSFHHRNDRVNNTSSYGYGKYANVFGEWSYYVAKTEYAFSVEKINHLIDYYLDGIFKQQVYAIYSDVSVANRSITHKAKFGPHSNLEIERLLQSTDYRKEELEEVMKLRTGESKPSQSFAKFFWQTEHFVFQRPNFYTTVRMFSTRNRNMEEPYNGPGKPTHHRADGTNYLMLKGDEYHNIWPVYDWQKVSGTTILQKPELHPPSEIQKNGLTDFVGAVTDGQYGAAVFDFKSPHDGVEAKKSWFFFDKEYVCLGTDICSDRFGFRSRSGDIPSEIPSVSTTINQALMQSDVTVSQNSKVETLPEGNRVLENVKWVHQDKVGYIFPEPATINLSNQIQEGRWSDITDEKNISDELISEKVFMLWFDHGKRPESASYQYIVIPNVTEAELTETSASNRNIEILSNTSEIQGVKHSKLDICQIAFYKAGEVEIADDTKIRIDSQGMAMIKMKENKIEKLSVSDPSRKLGRITLTVSGIYHAKGDNFFTMPDNSKNHTLVLIDLPQGVYAGKSVTVDF
ncbi:MAG: chondroitin lyase [Candidatus Latescibacteria bacterium]|jgi:chondroitin AC lyase|nr:chondroitin lyase [Candidatus Latescibacterota bacterium]MBT4140201.1 chondroitin lyase [Candidatus Latescibacterota bacterium]